MDKKKIFKEVLEGCKNGKFNEALSSLNKYGDVDKKCAISLIVSCCNSCVSNNSSPENITEIHLHKLLNHIISFVKELDENELLSYLQSIYFILKLLIKKKSFDVIVKMENLLLPVFLPLSLPKKHCDTYRNSISLLHNLIARLGNENDSKYNELLLEISFIISRMCGHISNLSSLLAMSYNCAISLSNSGSTLDQQEKYFNVVFDLILKEKSSAVSEEDFKTFMSYFTFMLNTALKAFNFKKTLTLYERSIAVGGQIFDKEECKNILSLFKFPIILSPLECEDKLKCLNKCKKSLMKLIEDGNKQLLGNKLSMLIFMVVSYYKTVGNKEWCDINEDFQLELLQFIYSLGKYESQSKSRCFIEVNVYQGFTYSQYISTLLLVYIQQKRKISADYHRRGSSFLIKFCNNIQILKEHDCDKWKSAWNTLGMAIYNKGVYLYQQSDEGCLFYFYNLIKYFIKFEGTSKIVVLKFSIISSAFTVICSMNTDYKKCMAFSALSIVLCPNQRDSLILHWIKAKASQRDCKNVEKDEVQRMTLVSVFEVFKKEMSCLTNEVNLLNETTKVDLLIYELEQYKKRWKSKIPIMATFKELYKIADLKKIVEVVVKIFGDCEMSLHADVREMLNEILKKYEASIRKELRGSLDNNLYLAVLYHIHYKCSVKDIVAKNTDEMERNVIVTQKTDESPDGIPKDPADECDIVSSYEYLKLDRYFSVMKYLNKSLDLFSSVIIDNNLDNINSNTLSLICNLLIKISFEYRLHRHKIRSLQALQMALKIAQLKNDPNLIVQLVGFIVENSDMAKTYVKFLIMLADKQLEDIEFTSLTNLKIVLTYYICKIKAYIYYDFKEAYRIFKMADDLYKIQENKADLGLINCQLQLLHFKFVMLPCKFEIVDHRTSTLLKVHSANATIYEVYNNSRIDGSYELSVLLDANEELINLYHLMYSPREVRAYCKDIVLLSQKLVLPLRCALYLVYLSHADLRSSRFDDCQVKLDGLADILCLSKHNVHCEYESKRSGFVSLDKEIDNVTNDLEEMVLDVPVPNNYKKQFSPSSPTLVIQPFHLPSFVSHDESCVCFYCICLEYQGLVLEKIRLDALINIKQNNVAIAEDFFHAALDLYEYFDRKYESYNEIIVEFISYDLIPDYKKEFLKSYGYILFDYSNQLMRAKNKSDALDINKKLLNLISCRKIEYIYLYNEALGQKLGHIANIPSTAKKVDKPHLGMDNLDISEAQATENLPVTPESKQSNVVVPVAHMPCFSVSKKIIKKIAFNLSPEGEFQKENSNIVKILKSPISKRIPKTPAPKMNIFAEDSTNTSKLKTPAPKIKIFNEISKRSTKKRNPGADDVFIIPGSPEAAKTPSLPPLRKDSALKLKTKLLTEKLRQSSKKIEVPSISSNNENVCKNLLQNSQKKISVRKNLLTELSTSDNEQNVAQGGAIRRSTRTRKV